MLGLHASKDGSLPVQEVCVVVLVGLLVPEDEAAVDVPLLHLEGHDFKILMENQSCTVKMLHCTVPCT